MKKWKIKLKKISYLIKDDKRINIEKQNMQSACMWLEEGAWVSQ